ncbi:ABC transporter ATP-binding protein [Clostridium sp. D2Q-11]|uniref:ABC transporter ATP-binding protein n=1 Tax=Anaeromonas frigoriresistens TaxID=2683708 RepID=A0A942Z975_9FIRM|nr:ABC transporter ATP-binding protein [Anaeromonas frigoriresistens]MBS4539033.1 ABC transporter ATP-binding protein [Anaeromonas frigoriresistens]
MKNLIKLFKYLKSYTIYALLAVIFMFVEVLAGLYIPYLMARIIDDALPSGDLILLRNTALIMILMAFGTILAGLVNNYCAQYISQYATANLRLDLFKKIQGLSFINVDKFKTGRLITSSTNDILQIQNFFMFLFRAIIRGPIMLVGGLILAIKTSVELSAIYIIIIPLLIIGISIIMTKALPLFTKVQEKVDALNNTVLENVNSPRVIKSFVSMSYENKRFAEKNEDYRKTSTQANKTIAYAMPIITIIINLGIAGILYLSAGLIENGILVTDGLADAGIIIAFFNYTMQILMGLLMLAMMLIFVSRAEASAKRINEIIEEEVDLTNSSNPIKDFKLTGDIEFRNVDFSYTQDGNNVLNDISFKVKRGETIGIIGSTGSGKSSLVQLIPRLYDVRSGEILLDGYNIKRLDIKSLRGQISMATQKPILFSGTIKSNILQGNQDATKEELESSANNAASIDFIDNLDDRFDAEVQKKGNNFSGGQKQRLSLARAFIKNPAILILDDTTSALDANSEEIVKKNIKELGKRTTTLIISQKVSTIMDADKILVMDNYGSLDGFDHHYKLLEKSKVYKEIYNSQFGVGGVENE